MIDIDYDSFWGAPSYIDSHSSNTGLNFQSKQVNIKE